MQPSIHCRLAQPPRDYKASPGRQPAYVFPGTLSLQALQAHPCRAFAGEPHTHLIVGRILGLKSHAAPSPHNTVAQMPRYLPRLRIPL